MICLPFRRHDWRESRIEYPSGLVLHWKDCLRCGDRVPMDQISLWTRIKAGLFMVLFVPYSLFCGK